MTGVPNRILAIEHLSLAALTSAPRNPRQHTAAQVKRIAASMRQFGNNVPILVDADGRVICGHARLLAAGRLGLSEVPVIRLAHLSQHRRKPSRLRITAWRNWRPGTSVFWARFLRN